MKILVTGGAGFIGSHVVDGYVSQGHEVVVVDNLVTGFRENVNSDAKFYEVSICDKGLEEIFEKEKFDIVNHHAAQMDVRKSVDDPFFDAEQNILGSLRLIENCLKFKVKKIIYASTGSALYGEVENLPVNEHHLVNPLSQYGISKHTVEHYLFLYRQLYGLDYTILRYPNVYGPRQNPWGEAGVVAIFTCQLLNKIRPTIFGDGTKTRDYVNIIDIVEANLLSLTGGGGEIYNLGTGIETTDRQVYDVVASALGLGVEPQYALVRPGEISRIALDASKAERELGWRAKVPFESKMQLTVEYLKHDPRVRKGG